MSYIDTLQLYEDYLASGKEPNMAKADAKILGALLANTNDDYALKKDLDSLEKRINIHFNYTHIIEVIIFMGILLLLFK